MLKEYVSSGKWLEDFAAMSAAIGCDRTRLHHRIGHRRIDRSKVIIMETRKHLAAEKKRQNTHNCAQSVVCTYCDLVGLDEQTALDIAGAYGTGMGNMEGTCGALVGAGMIVGLATKDRIKSRARGESPAWTKAPFPSMSSSGSTCWASVPNRPCRATVPPSTASGHKKRKMC